MMRVAPLPPIDSREGQLYELQHQLDQVSARARGIEAQLAARRGPPLGATAEPYAVGHGYVPADRVWSTVAPPAAAGACSTASFPGAGKPAGEQEAKTRGTLKRMETNYIREPDVAEKRSCTACLGPWIAMIVSLAAYLGIGCAVYMQVEGWTAIESIYFCMVTMSTVGYGDYGPTTVGTKAFTCLWIVVGIAAIFTQVSSLISLTLFRPISRMGRAFLSRLFPAQVLDIDGDGEADFTYPRHWAIYYTKNLLPTLLLIISVNLLTALAFELIEGWSYSDALYHCVVTATTVGYGDMKIKTKGGQCMASLHILISVSMVGTGVHARARPACPHPSPAPRAHVTCATHGTGRRGARVLLGAQGGSLRAAAPPHPNPAQVGCQHARQLN